MKVVRSIHEEEGALHGLKAGDTHPETGMVFFGNMFVTQAVYRHMRIRLQLYNIQRRAITTGIPFELTESWFEAAWPPNGRCEVLPYISLTWGSADIRTSPSIDRIRPELGYVPTNCRIISNRANTLKNNATAQEMALVLADLRKYDSAH